MFEINHGTGLTLTEIAEGLTVEDVLKTTGSPFQVRSVINKTFLCLKNKNLKIVC